MSVCLWTQAGWACSAGCIADFERTTATVFIGVAVSVGSSSYHVSKSFGAPENDEKPEPEASSFGARDFQYRFEANGRAMRDGLLRASGVEYVWVTEKLLEVAPVKQDVFRCKILREHSTLKALLARTQSGSSAHVYDWLVLISQRVENEQDLSNRC